MSAGLTQLIRPLALMTLIKNQGRHSDLRGEAEAMAGATAGRRSGSGLWSGEDLAKAGGPPTRGARGCVCVLRSTGTRGRAADARGCAARHGRKMGARRCGWGGHDRQSSTRLPCEHACELDSDRELAHPGRKAYPGGVASAHGGRNTGERGWCGTERGKRMRLYTLRTRACTCLGARVRERDVWCEHVHAGAKTITEGQNGCGDVATGPRTEKGVDG
jgi:hypothetical protein